MGLSPNKIVQAYIQSLLEINNDLQLIFLRAKNFKDQFEKILIDKKISSLLTEEEFNEINSFHQALDIIAKLSILNILQDKDVPSHGTKALEIQSEGK